MQKNTIFSHRADAPHSSPALVPAADRHAPTASAAAVPAAGIPTDPLSSAPAAGRHTRIHEPAPPSVPASPRHIRDRRRTAFVLAGGASLGALHVGMLRALYERAITPDMLIGTSAGALNAAFVATRPQTVHTATELGRVWAALHREDVFPIHPRTLICGLGRHRDHLVPDQPLRRLVSRHLQLERLEQANVSLHVVCFDLLGGEETRLSEGSAVEAVVAAAAIPGVFPPVPWQGRLLVDGGVVNNTPISHAVELGAERIYVLATEDPYDRALPAPPRGALDAAVHAMTLLAGARLQSDLARYASAVELIVLRAGNPTRVQPTDFAHANRLMGAALKNARSTLGGIRLLDPLAA